MSRRRKAREIALQALYAAEISGSEWQDVLDDMLKRRNPSDEAAEYARRLVSSVNESRDELDRMIVECLENWKFERVSVIDRNILRIALAELIHFPEVPGGVIINEAIEIAHRFSSNKAGKFVNGILDRLAGEVRKD
ncbi:MAG: transcription antitermination factor NusB [Candidatus Krumholzibacteria bacterium]|jgi:N utilization substance protein B|nr:transcription antitermination factor NusB [Candidatus Krumholzibacteria bacterium]